MASCSSAFAIMVSGNGQLYAIFKNALAVVRQTTAIVAGNGNHRTSFHLAVLNTRSQFQAGIVALVRVIGDSQCRGTVHKKRIADVYTIHSITVRNDLRMVRNIQLRSRNTMASITDKTDPRIFNVIHGSIRSIATMILYIHRAVFNPDIIGAHKSRIAVAGSKSGIKNINAISRISRTTIPSHGATSGWVIFDVYLTAVKGN